MTDNNKRNSAIAGAAFLMATSAIGPGFLTQTSLFTQELLGSLGFAILISILIDLGAQLNIWRIVTASEMRAQDLANRVVPGLGYFLALIVAFGGFVFNIGNIAGCGLGIQVLTGIDVKWGAVISMVLALGIFWYKEAGVLIDKLVKILGLLMVLLTLYIAMASHPPLTTALYRTIWPENISSMKIVTLVGGTVGGYISFAGAHRLLDAGIKGRHQLKQAAKSSARGILITSLMRYILFLAALGVVCQGIKLADKDPAGSVFRAAAGNMGYKFFGVVLWSAAITSVIGASYTSVSFWNTLSPIVRRYEKPVISLFIVASAVVFVLVGNPVMLLVLAGAVNGVLLPLALTVMLIAANLPLLMQQYRHPLLLQVLGWIAVAVMTWMGYDTIVQLLK